jgi:uncharacterized Zn finger protein
MQCATCGAVAENVTPGGFDGLVVRCERCGTYEIAGTAERAAVLERVKRSTPPGGRPCVTTAAL